jgi:hypothetical protein
MSKQNDAEKRAEEIEREHAAAVRDALARVRWSLGRSVPRR